MPHPHSRPPPRTPTGPPPDPQSSVGSGGPHGVRGTPRIGTPRIGTPRITFTCQLHHCTHAPPAASATAVPAETRPPPYAKKQSRLSAEVGRQRRCRRRLRCWQHLLDRCCSCLSFSLIAVDQAKINVTSLSNSSTQSVRKAAYAPEHLVLQRYVAHHLRASILHASPVVAIRRQSPRSRPAGSGMRVEGQWSAQTVAKEPCHHCQTSTPWKNLLELD